jgi:iron complex outermembrane receptor protein
MDVPRLSIEELMNIEITPVSKKLETLSDAAAAAFVIANNDIRRFGFTTVPEALR